MVLAFGVGGLGGCQDCDGVEEGSECPSPYKCAYLELLNEPGLDMIVFVGAINMAVRIDAPLICFVLKQSTLSCIVLARVARLSRF